VAVDGASKIQNTTQVYKCTYGSSHRLGGKHYCSSVRVCS